MAKAAAAKAAPKSDQKSKSKSVDPKALAAKSKAPAKAKVEVSKSPSAPVVSAAKTKPGRPPKFSADIVAKIRKDYGGAPSRKRRASNGDVTYKALAAKYDTTPGVIMNVVRRTGGYASL